MLYVLLAVLLFTMPITYKIAKRQERIDFVTGGVFMAITVVLFFLISYFTDKSLLKVIAWSLIVGGLATSLISRYINRDSFIVYTFIFVFCISGGGIGLSVIATEGWMLMGKDIPTLFKGETYEAEVYDYDSQVKKVGFRYRPYNDLFYYPHVRFTTREGKIVTYRMKASSTFEPEMGEKYTLYYDAATGGIFEFRSLSLYANILATGAAVAFLFAMLGTVLFAFRRDMSRYFKVLAIAGYTLLFGFLILFASLLVKLMLDPYPIMMRIMFGLFAAMLLFLEVVWIRYLWKNRQKMG